MDQLIFKKLPSNIKGKRCFYNNKKMVLEQQGKVKRKKESQPLPHTTQKTNFKMDHRSKRVIKSVEDNTEEYFHDSGDKQRFLRIPKVLTIKEIK